MSPPLLASAETKISVGPSRVTMPAELNEMVQYHYESVHSAGGGGYAGGLLELEEFEVRQYVYFLRAAYRFEKCCKNMCMPATALL